MKYYIKDTTVKKVVRLDTYQQVVNYLEGVCQRKFKKTRKQYMDDAVSLGYSPDDNSSTEFVRLLSEAVEVGIIRDNNLRMKTDVTNIERYNKPEFGD